jgi:NAD(P)-dependent dehydrogenase (short-subunit alcohol dehydrogenase family)
MTIADKAVLVTGANRGIGRALVEEALKRGAKRLYAGTRQPFAHLDGRVTRLALDVTSAEQIQRAVDEVGTLDVLINNAGIAMYDDLSKPEVIEQHLKVNLFGPLSVTRAFLPLLKRSKGAIVNNLSTSALAALPIIPGYSISKAATLSMTQSLRARSNPNGHFRPTLARSLARNIKCPCASSITSMQRAKLIWSESTLTLEASSLSSNSRKQQS